MITDKKITFDSFIRGIIIGGIIIGILALIKRLSSVLLPFFIAWLLAYLLYPIVHFFQYKLRIKYRLPAILATFLLILLIGALCFLFIIPPLFDEFARFRKLLIAYFNGESANSNIPTIITEYLRDTMDQQGIAEILSRAGVMEAIKTTIPKIWAFVSESVNLLFSLFTAFIVLLYLVFILLDYESISEGWIKFVPERYRAPISSVTNDVIDGMSRYFRGQALVALCVGILFSIGFLIIDFPLAIGLGLFIGLLNLVPYLQIIGFVPTLLLAILKAVDTGGNFWLILFSALAVFAIVQLIQDAYIVPRVMGKITGLNPAIILLSLSVWGSLMGMVGLIIALPATTLGISYYKRFILKKRD